MRIGSGHSNAQTVTVTPATTIQSNALSSGSGGQVIATLSEGDCFGEVALLLSEARNATVRAKTTCDLFVLDKADFCRILRDQQQFAQAIQQIARDRYERAIEMEHLLALA